MVFITRSFLTFFLLALCFLVNASETSKKRIIVHYKKSVVSALKTVSDAASYEVINVSEDAFEDTMESLKTSPFVESVEEDLLLKRVSLNDPLLNSQWALFDQDSGIRIEEAWAVTTGSQNVVAVIDTGILNHDDINAQLLPGADLISDLQVANDGDGRDSDASDPGDWIDQNDSWCFGNVSGSSWHGSHVAGVIAAESNNSLGMAGINRHAKILPVRVLGKCGGYTSDIADGIRWAVGGQVSGLPVNQNPAKVINLSLGGFGPCGETMQSAIDFARSQGAVVVVAAGNSALNLEQFSFTPATCRGVITVGASTVNSTMASYSNYGEHIDVSAPGGDSFNGILSLSNLGSTTPLSNGDDYRSLMGTSMAAPHVAGLASLIFSVKPGLFPAQVEDIIKRTASSEDIFCSNCGTGLINAFEAIKLAEIVDPDPNFVGDEPIEVVERVAVTTRLFTQEEEAGGCGSISMDNGGKPPGGGSLIAGLALIMLLGFSRKYLKSNQS